MNDNKTLSRTRPARLLTVLAAAAVLAGCSLMPVYERPAAPVPADWPGAAAGAAPASPLAWADFVADARLRELMALALQNNRDLRVATLNIEQVRAQYQIRQADQVPNLNLAASGNRQPASGGGISSSYQVGLAMSSWEIDFFGRIASLKEAALAQYLASEAARNAAQTSLVAAVASTWLSLQANDELLDLTRRTLATRSDSLRLTRLRFDNGATSALDLRQAESLTAAAQAALAQQSRQRALDLNALTLLVGQPLPSALVAPAAAQAAQPLFRDVPAGLPSDLLARRADILQAEQQLMAANANIGAARAAFFPRLALTASVGTASGDLSGLFKDGSWGFTLSPQALLPIFDAGRNQAGLDGAQAARAVAVAQYEKAIQSAFREVADALAGRATLGEQLHAQQAQATAEAERLRLAELRYRNGVSSFLDVLDAQRSLFATQQGLTQTRLAQQQNQVALYKALGGGWSE
ncbi:MAG: efflux transporter outer membrane subunit [Hydrogenophaga sp.]|jgi:multidrug efflux system outer membrane protein|uniref:efflux transporter outer membrane subunit n=1 Tax=Hydrogenophaga sp. TaxID=1904254 RepID=UPI002723AD53|nr:efflux transporter outer membrane subunit [Hydrogenophaga sp.]MDO9571112.1 efflux transporter outer membrane subunit [Hydrogenophaga sp.]MDP1894192.1 efflux transporter outer membrane subunit [Hydrogenophaga sp.]MDP2219662.1 efflux transporter outer membrane subunit [Hydrogenophaga sp.]MDP3926231.1 efflux transporter outer membrane subunit [Hydrogenophaga sp.]